MKRSATLMALVLLVAACGDDDATSETTTTTSPVTTTTAPPATTTTAVATTTTAAPTPTLPPFESDPANLFPPVFGDPGDPHGSGCVVDGDALTAGVWFGFAESVADGVITFDLACFFTGPAAVAAATADGEIGFDLDFYIRNQNPRVFTVPIDGSAEIWIVDGTTIESVLLAGPWPSAGSYLECPGEFCAVWLYVNGGVATGIVEQYLP